MLEDPATPAPDLRAGRFVASLRSGKGLSPEQMGKLCGVSGGTIRNIEAGTWPQLSTQERIAAFFGMSKEQIWRDPRPPIQRPRTTSQKAVMAVEAAAADPSALAALEDLPDSSSFAFGIAWAVIRGQMPYAPSQTVTDRALLAVEEAHGAGRPAPAGA